MSDELVFKSRAQARQYFTRLNDADRLATVDADYAHLPDRVESRASSPRPNVADVRTQPYRTNR